MAKRTDYQITIDDALTKNLNQHNLINDYMTFCTARLYQKFQGDPRVFFYVKGSAALSRYLRMGKVPAETIDQICARSDWDTQLVIDPGLSRGEWFTAFRECLTTIREYLDNFEEGLLAVFTRILLAQQKVPSAVLRGKSKDPDIRKEQNALAKILREAVAGQFGQWFLATSRTEGFIAEGQRHWDLPWQNIDRLAPGKVKDILELDIQAHSQATLTFALIHPGQALDNLNSIMTGRELSLLKETSQAVADGAWTKMETAIDAYDRLWIGLISQTPAVVEFLKGMIPASFPEATLISALPTRIIELTIGKLPGKDKDQLGKLWAPVKAARADEEEDEEDSAREIEFADALSSSLKASREVAEPLVKWCQDNIASQREMLEAMAALQYPEVVKRLSKEQKDQLTKADAQVEAWLDRYHEEPDPEDVAEAEKREIETLTPFTLVGVEKGGRKIGSILENMTIRDFYLFRLMIRCQLSNKDPDNRLIPDPPPGADFDSFRQRFKFRAELLDISVPRDDSLETGEQWAHVKGHVKPDPQGVPLPDGGYFLDEYILMFREVLDKKSSSVHKLNKRLRRACLIAEVYARELGGDLIKRRDELAKKYPVFGAALEANPPIAAANLVVFMRMCEQLTDSYDLAANARLGIDSAPMMAYFGQQIRSFLGTKLTEVTFLELMRVYDRLSRLIHSQVFVLGQVRRKQFPDEKLFRVAAAVMAQIKAAFKEDPAMVRCAIVEDFAIKAVPDLPDSLKQDVPHNVLTIVVYAKRASSDAMRKVAEALAQSIAKMEEGFDAFIGGGNLYARYPQDQEAPHGPESIRGPRKAVFLKIKFVFDDNVGNWTVPAHRHDLRAIVKQYRRSLPAYTEYHILTQKKEILQQMETALTTF